MMRGMAAMHAEYYGRLPSHRSMGATRLHMRFGKQRWLELEQFLGKFDVVGTMSRFDESLLLAADLSGLPMLLYKRNQPHYKGGFRGTDKTVCPDIEACRRVVQQVAPIDHRMYDKYSATFEARVRALGTAFEARVAEYKRAVAAAQPVWRKAPRKQTICRYHPETSEHVDVLKDDNIRCPVADLALCRKFYAHRLFECPWQFRPNSSLTDSLGCWNGASEFK